MFCSPGIHVTTYQNVRPPALELQSVIVQAFIGRFHGRFMEVLLSWLVTNAEIHFRAILHDTFQLQPKVAGILSSLDKLNMWQWSNTYRDTSPKWCPGPSRMGRGAEEHVK